MGIVIGARSDARWEECAEDNEVQHQHKILKRTRTSSSRGCGRDLENVRELMGALRLRSKC